MNSIKKAIALHAVDEKDLYTTPEMVDICHTGLGAIKCIGGKQQSKATMSAAIGIWEASGHEALQDALAQMLPASQAGKACLKNRLAQDRKKTAAADRLRAKLAQKQAQ